MVLFVSYSGAFGGAERLLLDFAEDLRRPCAIACPPGELNSTARARGVRTFALRTRSLRLRGGAATGAAAIRDLIAHRREVTRLIGVLEPELVVAWGMRSLLALAPRRAGSPLAFQHNDFLPGPAVGALVRAAARRAELTTVPSRAVADDLDPDGRLATRLEVIAPGVALERFASTAEPAQPPEIVVVGAITAWKRPDLALEAFAQARGRLPTGTRLRFAGAPLPGEPDTYLDTLRAQAARLGLADGVEFAGAVADVPRALARASCLLHCAEREPFGIAVLEALAAGRPAVVPDAAGPAEIVDAHSGRRYPPGDAAAAARALGETLADPHTSARLGAAGRARATERFSLAGQRERYRAALGRLGSPVRRRPAVRSGQLALVTVTHNSAADLDRLLRSAARHLPDASIVVADCASSDDTAARARSHSATTVIELPNLGFGRASNRAVAEVQAPVVALVNPDVELLDDSLLTLAARALEGPDRLLAPRVLNPDGSLQDTVHPAPLSAADLIRSVVPPAALPGRLGAPLAPWRSDRPRPVGWAVGCALVARTDTLRRLGPFDERIFLYGEDMELGIRAARSGVPTWLAPEARVVHRGGHSIETAHSGEAFELRAKARHDAVVLALGRRRAALDDLAQALTFGSRFALKRALRRPADREARQLAALRAVRRA
jgi:N-acetylglucosaminyl-diphospho-decaprenol L-rhamnosyltransferase